MKNKVRMRPLRKLVMTLIKYLENGRIGEAIDVLYKLAVYVGITVEEDELGVKYVRYK